MAQKRHKQRARQRRPPRQPVGSTRLTTPEGDLLVLASARYRHAGMETIRPILGQADDFNLDEDLEPDADGALQFVWYETGPGARPLPAPMERRILASLTLTPATLEVETTSERRLARCRRRLEALLGDRIRLIETQTRSAAEALAEGPPAEAPEPLILPPEVVAGLEERMLRQWIDDSIPALGGMTPREAAKTPEGRRQLMALLDYIEDQQARVPPSPGMFTPDYRKVVQMLGLE